MDWSLCLICQKETTEETRCPKDRCIGDAIDIYRRFLENVAKFRELDALSTNLLFGPEVLGETL